ncbi:carbohydrate kinase family protein [Methylolobus aquaticus]
MNDVFPAPTAIDVLCVGHASFDLVLTVPHHPDADEKLFADSLLGCGGGPAANAAVTAARLGSRAAFAGYLGQDLYGSTHLEELQHARVDTRLVVRGSSPTPLSVVLVKPDGRRALVNYKGGTEALRADAIDFSPLAPRVVLFDGHEPDISTPLATDIRRAGAAITVLDAGSLHRGTQALMGHVDHLVCSEKFAAQWLQKDDPAEALGRLAQVAPAVVITLGERGLIWRIGGEQGTLNAFVIHAVDTTGAGDAFHGAFAAGLAAGLPWTELLRLASAAGALCCERLGARPAIPTQAEVSALLSRGTAIG